MEIIRSIQARIYELRGERVMLDRDLADLYEVPVKILNQAVKRNLERFPRDFMFQLTREEQEALALQNKALEMQGQTDSPGQAEPRTYWMKMHQSASGRIEKKLGFENVF